MFDLATRPQPAAAMQMGTPSVPFDLRLAPPAAARPYPYTSLVNATGAL